MDKNEQIVKASDQTKEHGHNHTEEADLANEKNKRNQVTEASQKGKSVDRDVTDPATDPEE